MKSTGIRFVGRTSKAVNITLPVELVDRIERLRTALKKRGQELNVSALTAAHLEPAIAELEKKEERRGKR